MENATPGTARASDRSDGLVLQPFRAARPSADGDRLAALLCPPYDVIDAAHRAELIARDPDNAVSVILPEPADDPDRYETAAHRLQDWVDDGHYRIDETPALYVYEMTDAAGATTRGLVGALELRDPADGVVLPHENTMAGPVADRLALMSATQADVEAIYLVYDGGGAASQAVASVEDAVPLAQATTPDGITHRLWSLSDPDVHAAVAADLASRRALIADGHHRYATYRELQQQLRAERGAGPWDFGLTLLVDSTSYGPQVHAIHRVLLVRGLADAVGAATRFGGHMTEASSPEDALRALDAVEGFAIALSDGTRSVVLTDPDGVIRAAAARPGEPAALVELDVTVLHRGLVEAVWDLTDSVDTVG
ncbi:MAG TPA: DUF1015 domain-containing protein, partial [Jatrophihabitantaceae bacterium]